MDPAVSPPAMTTPATVATILEELEQVLRARKREDPEQSYVAGLLRDGSDAVLRKVGEECVETLLAAKNGSRAEVIHEVADLWFHLLVMMVDLDIGTREILNELVARVRPPSPWDPEALPQTAGDQRGYQRRVHALVLNLHMANGLRLTGETRDLSLTGLRLKTAFRPVWQLVGEVGFFELKLHQRSHRFEFEVVRIRGEDEIALQLQKDAGLFGYVLSQDAFRDLF